MNKEMFRLLGRHISISQLVAFVAANAVGVLLLIAAVQFYCDVRPLFGEGEGLMKSEYLVVTKKVTTASMFSKDAQAFTDEEIKDLMDQPFTKAVGKFTPSHFEVMAAAEIPGGNYFSTDMFFEAVPNEFVDVKAEDFCWKERIREIPIVLPRNYLNLYNFGFAQSQGLPKLSESAISLLPLRIYVISDSYPRRQEFAGRVVGFSDRLNTILVPEDFLLWANERYGDGQSHLPTRLIIEVNNPADSAINKYFAEHELLAEQNNLDTGKIAWFLGIIIFIVLSIGVVICSLAFYMLLLSIFLLVQKNQEKLLTLRLLGYSIRVVSLPYVLLVAFLNVAVLSVDWIIFLFIRKIYMDALCVMFPGVGGSLWATFALSLAVLLAVTLLNTLIIRRKIKSL